MWILVIVTISLQTVQILSSCGTCQPYKCTWETDCYSCISGYYLDYPWCYPCPQACRTCVWKTSCTSCGYGYYLYYQTCQSCQQNCKVCSGSYSCITCNDGYYLRNNECQACPQNCKACLRLDWCNICNDGYYWDTHVCQPCQQGCTTCSNTGSCCIDGYYWNNYICQRCPQGCATCIWSDRCTSCNGQYYLDRYECYPCPHNCEACTLESKSTCKTCKDGYYGDGCTIPCSDRCYNGTCDKTSGNCRYGCVDGYYGFKCQQKCASHCSVCDITSKCHNCEIGYYGPSCENNCSKSCLADCSKDEGKCSECADGYYKESTECKACSMGCANCHDDEACDECQDGYYPERDTRLCSDCGLHCSQCSSKDNCSNCHDGNAIVNGVCISCQNCKGRTTCSLQNDCHQCREGFLGAYCRERCNDTCIRCDKATGECTECKDNTFGQYCELKCSRNCLQLSDTNSTCEQHNGTCTDGCVQAFTGSDCTEEIPPQTSANVFVIVGSTSGGIVVLVTVVIVGIIMWRRRVNRPDLKAGGGYPSGARDPRAVNVQLNPVYNDIDVDAAIESGNQTAPAGINVASDDHAYAVVQKKTTRKPGQPAKTRGQDDGTDNVYDVASAGHAQGGAANTYKSRSLVDEDTYSHINHTSGLRQHRHDNEGTYDQVMRQNVQKGDVDDTYDVTGGQTSRIYDHNVKVSANTSIDDYSTIGNVL